MHSRDVFGKGQSSPWLVTVAPWPWLDRHMQMSVLADLSLKSHYSYHVGHVTVCVRTITRKLACGVDISRLKNSGTISVF